MHAGAARNAKTTIFHFREFKEFGPRYLAYRTQGAASCGSSQHLQLIMAKDNTKQHLQPTTNVRRKHSLIPPINHWHSTFVVLVAVIIIMLSTGIYTTTSAGMLAAYGTSNWIRYIERERHINHSLFSSELYA